MWFINYGEKNMENREKDLLSLLAFMNKQSIEEFISNIHLNLEIDTTEDSLFLSTVHGSKGLEWEYVYLIDMTSKDFPNIRQDFYKFEANNCEEENIKEIIKDKNFKYKIRDIEKINSFELKSFNLRSYHHKNILAFGDLLHKVHPLAGQGFNMTIRDIKVLSQIIKKRIDLGLSLDSSVNFEFEKKIKYKNFIFSNGIDLIQKSKDKIFKSSCQSNKLIDFI